MQCATGGGFTKTEWSVRVNDGWMSLTQLVKRRRVGEIAADIENEEDPHGVASGVSWVDRPAQVWYRRETNVVAPVGTRFRKQVWTPVRDPRKGIWFDRSEAEFELRGEGRLVSLHILEERAARKAQRAARPEEPLSKSETRRHLGELLAELESGPAAGSTPEGANAGDTGTPPPVRRRKRAVELKRPAPPKQTGRKIA